MAVDGLKNGHGRDLCIELSSLPVLNALFVPRVDNVDSIMYVALRREQIADLKYSPPPM